MALDIPTALLLDIDQRFNKTELTAIAKHWLQPFLMGEKKLLVEKKVSRSILTAIERKANRKGLLVEMYALVFYDKDIFKKFEQSLHENARIVLKELIWSDKISERELLRKFNISVKTGRGDIKPSMLLFPVKRDYDWRNYGYIFHFSLPVEVRKLLIENYEKPVHYDLIPIEEIPKTQFVFEGEKDLFQELPRIVVYHAQNQIKLTKGGKPMAASVKKMGKSLKLKEFYPPKPYKETAFTRSYLLSHLIVTGGGYEKKPMDERLIDVLIANYNQKFLSTSGILSHLSGTHNINTRSQVNVEGVFLKIIKEFPANKWISIENVLAYIKYRMHDVRPVSTWDANQYLSISVAGKYARKSNISEDMYNTYITTPLIKGTFFFFAALGLMDIAYNLVDTSEMGKTYYSNYDNIRYVRLNNLGAYITRKTKTYEMPYTAAKDTLTFSEDALMITANEGNLTAEIILGDYARKIGTTRFVTDASTFMKGCQTKKDLQRKIKLFKQTVKQKLPENWETFFKDLLAKCNPLTKSAANVVYKLPNDPELIRLIARDLVLRKLVIKAENYHIIVLKNDFSNFKSRLKEFGYLIE